MYRSLLNKVSFKLNLIVENVLPRYFYKSKILSSVYYTFFSSTFHREHQAVLAGKLFHKKTEENTFMLIRNTHRIEKGLTMQPRKRIFAKGYLTETIDCFIKLWNSSNDDSNVQLKWSKDVFSEYFKMVDGDDEINKAKEKFFETVENSKSSKLPSGPDLKPYPRSSINLSKTSYEEFYGLTKQRRSVRWYENKPVPRELIDKAILAAIQSPSACNRQPFEYRVFDEKSIVNQIIDLPMGTAGYGHNVPVLVVVIGNLNAYDSERDRHLIYVDASLANMTFMLALETLGLSSCSINWPDIEKREKKMEQALNLKKYQRPIMCMSVGYPDPKGGIPYSEKRNLEKIRNYNKIK